MYLAGRKGVPLRVLDPASAGWLGGGVVLDRRGRDSAEGDVVGAGRYDFTGPGVSYQGEGFEFGSHSLPGNHSSALAHQTLRTSEEFVDLAT